MALTDEQIKLLNDAGTKMATDPTRAALYRDVRAGYERRNPALEVTTGGPPNRPMRRRMEREYTAAEWADDRLDPADKVWAFNSGGVGAAASKQAAVAGVAADWLGGTGKGVLSSGANIAWTPALIGMALDDMRMMNADAPSDKFLQPIEGVTKEQKLWLAGGVHMQEVEDWLQRWFEWAGTSTFGDTKFPDGHPFPDGGLYRDTEGQWHKRGPDPYRISMGLSVMDLPGTYPIMSHGQLNSPGISGSILVHAFKKQLPIHTTRQRFFPNDVEVEFPHLKGEVDAMPLAKVARWSCLRWPWARPELIQDPDSGRIKIVFDGASVNTHPSLWMDGTPPTWSNGDFMRVLISRGKSSDRKVLPQSVIDTRERPFQHSMRSTPSGIGPLELTNLTVEERDAMFLAGVFEGVKQMQTLDALIYGSARDPHGRGESDPLYVAIREADGPEDLRAQAPLHGFNIILEDPATSPTMGARQLGW